MHNSKQLLSRLEKEWARKCAKRAHESSVEGDRQLEINREQNKCRRASESEVECEQRLAAG